MEKTQSAFQEAEIINTTTYGKMLMLDKQVQSSAMDEFIYHESLVHPTLLALPVAAKKVFIGKLPPTPHIHPDVTFPLFSLEQC